MLHFRTDKRYALFAELNFCGKMTARPKPIDGCTAQARHPANIIQADEDFGFVHFVSCVFVEQGDFDERASLPIRNFRRFLFLPFFVFG